MNLILLLLLIFFTKIILKEEKNTVKNKTEKEIIEEYNEEEGYFPGNAEGTDTQQVLFLGSVIMVFIKKFFFLISIF